MSNAFSTKRVSVARPSFTLVEMLIVLAIISILASAVLTAMYGVVEEAKVARTKAQVAKLHELIMSQMEGYQTRPLRLNIPASDKQNLSQFAVFRLLAIRDLMRMELPDRITDLNFGPTSISIPSGSVTPAVSSKWQSHRRRAGYAAASTTPPSSWSYRYQNPECLYLIIASIREGETTGLDYFQESEIGDVDGDGMREILDAWGNPIVFLRWAPGYVSEMQPQDPNIAPDPYDPLGRDTRPTFRLIPLIFSAGPDGIYDIVTDNGSPPLNYQSTSPPNDPYVVLGSGLQIGEPADADGDGEVDDVDNITNHLLEAS